jgi:fumarate reductase subunit D
VKETIAMTTYHKSSKPLVWFPFAAGGTVSAFLMPVLILATGFLVPLGILDAEALSYDKVHALASNVLGKIVLLVALLLPLWHGAHRFRMTVQDLGVRTPGARSVAAALCYGLGGLFSLLCVVALLTIW